MPKTHALVHACKLWLLLFLAALSTAACIKVGPNFSAPSVDVANHWIQSKDARVSAAESADKNWWKAFNDPVLDRLIRTAYDQNLSLRMAGIRVLEARASLGIAIGQFYPQMQQALGSVTYTRTPSSSFGISQSTQSDSGFSYWQSEIGLGLSWELDFWGRFRRAIESADMSFFSSIADYETTLVSLTADVASTYVLIRIIEERLRIAKDNVVIQKEGYQIADARFRGGATSERDVQQAITQLNSTEATIPQLQTSLQQAKNSLSVLLGIPPAELDGLLGSTSCIPVAPVQVAVGIPADLLRRRPDVRSAELQAAAQCAQIGVAKADLYPALSLSGNIGFTATDIGTSSLGDMFSWDNRSASVGPSFQWNLFNYGRIRNNIRLQDARFQELLVNYQNTVLKAQQEVEDGLIAFVKAQDAVQSYTRAATAAKRAVDLAMIQYREGATDYTTVLTAQQALLLQADNLASSQGDVPQGLITTYRALGGGWQISLGESFVPSATQKAMTERTDWGDLADTKNVVTPEPRRTEPLIPSPDW